MTSDNVRAGDERNSAAHRGQTVGEIEPTKARQTPRGTLSPATRRADCPNTASTRARQAARAAWPPGDVPRTHPRRGLRIHRRRGAQAALLYNMPRTATVVATAPTQLWALHRTIFQRTLADRGMRCIVREERGADEKAACGQLATSVASRRPAAAVAVGQPR